MELQELGILEKKEKQFNKAGIFTAEDLIQFLPRAYADRSVLTPLVSGQDCTFLAVVDGAKLTYKNRLGIIKAYCHTMDGQQVQVTWFNMEYRFSQISSMRGCSVVVGGKVELFDYVGNNGPVRYWSVTSPALFDYATQDAMRIYPSYKKIPGMAEEYLTDKIGKAMAAFQPVAENLPLEIIQDRSLISRSDMLANLHRPVNMPMLQEALRRQKYEDLLYFALRMRLSSTGAIGSPYNLPGISLVRQVEASLPYTLTPDQKSALNSALGVIRSGRRLNALIQGDVGSGKTIVAFLLMIAFAANGCQAVMMAPTQILASQHFEGLRRLASGFGLETAFITGARLKKAEQKALEEGISSGRIKLIVGTQALITAPYSYKRLALVIEDEEHKYGVLQREALVKKAAEGVHTVTMSATPIPRTLATVLYGDDMEVYSIQTKPPGRSPVRTGIARSMQDVYRYLVNIIRKGQQAYVVCPQITAGESTEGIASVEAYLNEYTAALSQYGISIAAVTGKTAKGEAQRLIQEFFANRISVLIATTVIEVGVDVPNATCIVIHNAERFGLAQLHQLRGRVGRGSLPGICVLVSEDRENQRLQALCNHTDGFEIAEIDLSIRGTGDLLGTAQSGNEKYLAMALTHPDEYKLAKQDADWIVREGVLCGLLKKAEADMEESGCGN